MGVPYDKAESALEAAAAELFNADKRVRSVGIGRDGNGYGFRVVRNAAMIVPMSATPVPGDVAGVPIHIVDRLTEVRHVGLRVPASGPGSPGRSSLVPEQLRRRPICCGLQIENWDDDERQVNGTPSEHSRNVIIVGTLGSFARDQNGAIALLSNNHVVAAENRGQRGNDRIIQAGSVAFNGADHVATLTDYVALQPSAVNATPAAGNVNFNDVDAGIASLAGGVGFNQAYLPGRTVNAPSGVSTPQVGDRVFKVGRTTGLTLGEITDIATIVGPISYAPGPVWFRRSFTVIGQGGSMFSDRGDSGSAVVRQGTGEVLGLLYAGNGFETYACRIDAVLAAFNATLV